jgi:ribosomal protein S1
VNPENNPWHSPFMTVNQVVKAKVARIGEDVVFLELPNGIVGKRS